MKEIDAIVVGVGAVGAATLEVLARRGARVLGIERFDPGHDRGSSHGLSRAIRLAYFEHPDYVPLLRRALARWEELDREGGEPLYRATGILEAGPAQGELVAGVRRAAEEHDLAVEELDPAALARRFPAFRLPPESAALYEARAGWLAPEAGVRRFVKRALDAGAELEIDTAVDGWMAEEGGFVVRAVGRRWHARRLILTQGAWSGRLVQELGLPLEVVRKVQLWYRPTTRDFLPPAQPGAPGFVPWAVETPSGQVFYGFPEVDERGVKIAEHSGGEAGVDPFRVDRELRDSDRAPVEAFAREHLPVLSDECTAHEVCLYTRTPDGHFVLDRHPEHPGLAYACGLSGHGFKLAPVLGEALADLALEGGTELPVDFLSAARFAADA